MATGIPEQSLPPGTRLEEFVIERVLGSGGFGITYLAKDVRLNRQVVIKENLPVQFCFRDTHSLTVAPRHSDGEDAANFQWSLESFSREAATLASLDHPGIVKVLRSFEAFGTAYFVMPFVEGMTLDALIEQRAAGGYGFDEPELQGLLAAVLDALGHLHSRGLYHRDVKPGNILITNDGHPVLIDFGSARQLVGERSMTVIQSPGYTPFEQLQSRGKVGPWSDLYALGATLHKLVAGKTPPKSMDRMPEDIYQPLTGRADLVRRFRPEFLAGIDRALAVGISDRWQDAWEWRKAMDGQDHAGSTGAEAESGGRATSRTGVGSIGVGQSGRPLVGNSKAGKGKRIALALTGSAMLGLLGWAVTRSGDGDTESARQEEDGTPREPVAGDRMDVEIANGMKMTFVWCPPGNFKMGSPPDEAGRFEDETQNLVTLSKGFWLAETEVTQGQWKAVMGSNPSRFTDDDKLPVERVSWEDSQVFISKARAPTGMELRLPTEAEWEYACRAGSAGACAGDLGEMGWYFGNSEEKTQLVGTKKPNNWGLKDMHGNVSEWCEDWYGEYPPWARTDPPGASTGVDRVLRGGSWSDSAAFCRSAVRVRVEEGVRNVTLGFRPALVSSQ